MPKAAKNENRWTFKQKQLALPKIEKHLSKHFIKVTDWNDKDLTSIVPIRKFTEVEFPEKLTRDLTKFKKPTDIQSVSWPVLFQGRDMVGIAATGSGKTMGFGLPALLHVQNSVNRGLKPLVLVISPTRELAMQIEQQFKLFGSSSQLKPCCIYGGVPKFEQKQSIKQGVDALICTPGRLIDLMEENNSVLDLSKIEYLVLDEADRMLEKGFEQDIKKIIKKLPTSKQTVMFSATWPQGKFTLMLAIRNLAFEFLKNPVKVTVGSPDLSANVSIEQRVEVVDQNDKERILGQLLKKYHNGKNRILIFCLYKKEAARIENVVKRLGYTVTAIHGDLSQEQRTRSMSLFQSGESPLLVATDVAARGIDIPNVEYVINVTFPLTVEDYCHRIGRTGRAGSTGISHTLFTIHDKTHSGILIN